MATRESYRVLLDEEWELEDLYVFPHALAQCYAFVYCLDSALAQRTQERINYALREYPWGGGYSYVNIYVVFKNQIPVSDRPKIKSISKSSPGWLELFLNVGVITQVATGISLLSSSALGALAVYKKGQGYLADIAARRRRAGIDELKASAAEMKEFNKLCVELAKHLGFNSLAELHAKTGDPEISLKLLMAHYRRMDAIVGFEKSGKALLPTSPVSRGSTSRGSKKRATGGRLARR